jgi:pimeloyl-ACP methyl ester carboxylesterase
MAAGGAARPVKTVVIRLRPFAGTVILVRRGPRTAGHCSLRTWRPNVEQMPAEEAVLCGHLVGGATAIQVAAQVPDRIAVLVLVEPPAPSTPTP